MTEPALHRRTVLAGLSAGTALVAAGCSSSSDGGSKSAASPASPTPTPTSGGGAATAPLATVADIPQGSAIAAKGPDGATIILARTGAQTVVGLSARCTHRGCTVAPQGRVLACPCHGSRYDAATGRVLRGPAPAPLARVPVKVEGGQVLPG